MLIHLISLKLRLYCDFCALFIRMKMGKITNNSKKIKRTIQRLSSNVVCTQFSGETKKKTHFNKQIFRY